MKVSTTVVLLVLLAVVIVAVIGVNKGWFAPSSETDRQLDKPLVELATEDIAGLTIARTRGGMIRLVKQAGTWRLVEPVRGPVKLTTVGRALDAVRDMAVKRQYAAGASDRPDPGRTGLDRPRFVVTFTRTAGDPVVVKIGSQRPLKPQTYVQLQGDETIYLMSGEPSEDLGKPIEQFRDDSMLNFVADDVQRLLASAGGQARYELVRSDDGWQAPAITGAAIDAGKVSELLGKLQRLTAAGFVTEQTTDLAPFGLETPKLAFTLTVEKKTTEQADTQPAGAPTPPPVKRRLHLAFGASASGKTFARLDSETWLFRVRDEDVEGLAMEFKELRDRRIVRTKADDVVEVLADSNDNKLALAKIGPEWRVLQPFAGSAHPPTVLKLLQAIADLKVKDFVDDYAGLAGYGLDPAKARFQLKTTDGASQTLLIGSPSESGLFAFVKFADAPTVMTVAADSLADLKADVNPYWSRTLLTLDRKKLRQLSIEGPGGLCRITQPSVGLFKMESPRQGSVDKENLDKLLIRLGLLTADEIVFVGDTVPARFTGDRAIRVILTTAEPQPAGEPTTTPATEATTQPATQLTTQPAPVPTETQVLHVAVLDGKTFAWIEDAEPIVVAALSDTFHEILTAELRDRRIWTADMGQVRAFTLTTAKGTVALAKTDGSWRHATDEFVKIDQGKVANFLSDVRMAKAERFLDAGPADPAELGLDKPDKVLRITTADGEMELVVSGKGPAGKTTKFATSTRIGDVFVLPTEVLAKLDLGVADFAAEDK